ncbi:hypothetical protein MNBD_GAMMA24-1835 [hydrothermal vent metagenome]|uniref:Outer membrane protein beta-barrel domain-containing protein n=1 Tax=hydrothermal vent metagenome TaxID=652676 RepID=A0A3B1C1A3_9ZZZZ
MPGKPATAAKYLFIGSLLCLSPGLMAQTFDNQGRLDFNVHLQSVYSDWRYANSRQRTNISRAGFGWSETLSPGLSGGIMLGYLDLGQSNNPLDAAKLSSGYYGGLQLETQLVERRYLHLKLNLSVLYNDSQNQAGTPSINNIWIQTEEKLQARIPLREQLALRLALNSYQLRGEQRSSGSVTDVSNFRQDQNIGYSIGLDVLVDPDASIGFDWSGGNRRGGRLYFRRLF